MSPADDITAFEQRLRALLEEDAGRASGRVRSHLTQARHAAVAQAVSGGAARRSASLGRHLLVPAAGVAAAAAVVTFVIWPHQPRPSPPAVTANSIASGDLDLLTDRDGLRLVEGGDGQFYQWAVYEAQAEPGQGSGGGAGNGH